MARRQGVDARVEHGHDDFLNHRDNETVRSTAKSSWPGPLDRLCRASPAKWPGHPRVAPSQSVDARVKHGHDGWSMPQVPSPLSG